MNSPFKNSRLKIAGADRISWAVVDAHIMLLFASIPGETRDQQVKASHHCSSCGGGRHVASVRVHPQFRITAAHYGAAILRLSHAEGSDALCAHKADGHTTERISAETDLQYDDVHKSNSAKLMGRGNTFHPLASTLEENLCWLEAIFGIAILLRLKSISNLDSSRMADRNINSAHAFPRNGALPNLRIISRRRETHLAAIGGQALSSAAASHRRPHMDNYKVLGAYGSSVISRHLSGACASTHSHWHIGGFGDVIEQSDFQLEGLCAVSTDSPVRL